MVVVILKAVATRGTFLFAQATQHFFLVLQGQRNQNVARLGRGSFPTVSLGQCCRKVIKLNFLHVTDVGGNWPHKQPPSNSFEDVKLKITGVATCNILVSQSLQRQKEVLCSYCVMKSPIFLTWFNLLIYCFAR